MDRSAHSTARRALEGRRPRPAQWLAHIAAGLGDGDRGAARRCGGCGGAAAIPRGKTTAPQKGHRQPPRAPVARQSRQTREQRGRWMTALPTQPVAKEQKQHSSLSAQHTFRLNPVERNEVAEAFTAQPRRRLPARVAGTPQTAQRGRRLLVVGPRLSARSALLATSRQGGGAPRPEQARPRGNAPLRGEAAAFSAVESPWPHQDPGSPSGAGTRDQTRAIAPPTGKQKKGL